MRPSQKSTEERTWVLDTINKYFDVIVEEEDEEEDEEEGDMWEDSDVESSEDEYVNSEIMDSSSEEEDIESLSLSDLEDGPTQQEQGVAPGFQSSARMREMLKKAASNVSSSQTNLVNMNQVKEKLGSRINIGLKQSVEQL